jgi:hypothetical protein
MIRRLDEYGDGPGAIFFGNRPMAAEVMGGVDTDR